jgi:hypothetical protein
MYKGRQIYVHGHCSELSIAIEVQSRVKLYSVGLCRSIQLIGHYSNFTSILLWKKNVLLDLF